MRALDDISMESLVKASCKYFPGTWLLAPPLIKTCDRNFPPLKWIKDLTHDT